MTFADLCCGSGAVTIRLIGGVDVDPPAPHMGGKRRFAASILDMLGARGQRPDRIILADAGPWGLFWEAVVVQGLGQKVAGALADLEDRWRLAGEDLFYKLGAEPVPTDPILRSAVFLALQHGNAMGRPVVVVDGRWRLQGYAHLSFTARERGFSERLRPRQIARGVQRVASLPWPRVEVVTCPLQEAVFDLGIGDVAYMDPPYKGTTDYFPAVLGREDLQIVAERLRATGATVGVSEGEPLPWAGWHSAPVEDGGAWQARSFGGKGEWLTTSSPPAPTSKQTALSLDSGPQVR